MKYILIMISSLFLLGCDIVGTSVHSCKELGWKGVISSEFEQYCSNGEKDAKNHWITSQGIKYDTATLKYHYIPFKTELSVLGDN